MSRRDVAAEPAATAPTTTPTSTPPPSQRLSYPQAAEYVSIKVGTLQSLVSRRQIPHIRITPRLVVFDRQALDEWLASKTVTPTAPRSTRARGLVAIGGGK